MQHADDIQEADINPLIVSDDAAPWRSTRASSSDNRAMSKTATSSRNSRRSSHPEDRRGDRRFGPRRRACRICSSGASASSATRARSIRSIPPRPRSTGFPPIAASPTRREPVDYAYIAMPAAQIPPMLASANGQAALRAGHLERIRRSRGRPRAAGANCVAAARAGGARLIGPNCLGLYTPRGNVTFAEIAARRKSAPSASSRRAAALAPTSSAAASNRGLKFSGLVTVGNCADVTPSRPARVLFRRRSDARDRHVHRDGARRPAALRDPARQRARAKPVVILKGGRTQAGHVAAASHTGSLAGDDRVWVALARQTGCMLVDTLDQFIDTLLALPVARRARRASDAQASCSSATAAARACLRPITSRGWGSTVTPFGTETIDALAQLKLPPGTSITNPVDCPVGTLQQDDGRVAEKILDIIYGIGKARRARHAPQPVGVRRTHEARGARQSRRGRAARAGALPRAGAFLLVLRSDGEPELEARKREFRAQGGGAGRAGVRRDVERGAGARGATVLRAFREQARRYISDPGRFR